MINERIKNSLSASLRDRISGLLPLEFTAINIGGDFLITGEYTLGDTSAPQQYSGNEFSIVRERSGEIVELSMSTTGAAWEHYGLGEVMHVNLHEHRSTKEDPLSILKRLRLKNQGILRLDLPATTTITGIEVYGVGVKGVQEVDPDFPDEGVSFDVDLDLLLKFNTDQGYFFTWHAKDGKIIHTFYTDAQQFETYLEMIKAWGKLRALRFKYQLG